MSSKNYYKLASVAEMKNSPIKLPINCIFLRTYRLQECKSDTDPTATNTPEENAICICTLDPQELQIDQCLLEIRYQAPVESESGGRLGKSNREDRALKVRVNESTSPFKQKGRQSVHTNLTPCWSLILSMKTPLFYSKMRNSKNCKPGLWDNPTSD